MKLEQYSPIKPTISADLLGQLDIRVGTIESVVDVTGSNKLVELHVSFGNHTRTILVGMKQERANLREVEGRQALFVVNLEPRRMAGRVSEGMLFDIGHADGLIPVLAIPEKPVPDGARAG
jgi:tRNA-binding protein